MTNKKRCAWSGDDQLYQDYHDYEWGKQVKDDRILFEFLVLESAQAGLSWITILRKRENYRACFANFDSQQGSQFKEQDVENLMQRTILLDVTHEKFIQSKRSCNNE